MSNKRNALATATRIFLGSASALLFAVGGMLAFAPQALYHQSRGALAADIVLNSDIRSGGALLLACAAFVAYAALRSVHRKPALCLAALAYLGDGLGRLVSFAFDGQMNATPIAITGVEWAFGIAALVFARGLSRRSRMSPAAMTAQPVWSMWRSIALAAGRQPAAAVARACRAVRRRRGEVGAGSGKGGVGAGSGQDRVRMKRTDVAQALSIPFEGCKVRPELRGLGDL